MQTATQRPTHSTITGISATDLIDAYAMERVEFHVNRLGRRYHLRQCDCDDLQQDLLLALCQAAPRFNPTLASAHTFVSRVLTRAAAYCARTIRNERRSSARSPIRLSELQHDGQSFAPPAPRAYQPDAIDLKIDLRGGIAATSRDHQLLAEALKTSTAAEIAAQRGQHRSTVYRGIAALREALTEEGVGPCA